MSPFCLIYGQISNTLTRTLITVDKAAILHKGIVYSVERPGRHHDVIRLIVESGGCKPFSFQGFVLSNGDFALRSTSAQIAIDAKQIEKLQHPPLLYSEDL